MLNIHRILGTSLSILFLVWFLSGLVMIYHTFPRADRTDKRAKMEYLIADSLPSLQDIGQRLPEGTRMKSVILDRYLGQTVFHIHTEKGDYDIPADSSGILPVIDDARIRRVASLWCQSPVGRIDTLFTLDQWIPFGRLREEFPIYKFHFEDPRRITETTRKIKQIPDNQTLSGISFF